MALNLDFCYGNHRSKFSFIGLEGKAFQPASHTILDFFVMGKRLKKNFPESQGPASRDQDLRQKLMKHLKKLPAGATMCPGRLARDCGTVLNAARSDLFDLASTGNIRLSQRGKTVNPQELKGPFRVSLRITPKSKRVKK